jgi:hypothetical protein
MANNYRDADLFNALDKGNLGNAQTDGLSNGDRQSLSRIPND